VPVLPVLEGYPDLLAEALEAARKLGDDADRSFVLAALAPVLKGGPCQSIRNWTNMNFTALMILLVAISCRIFADPVPPGSIEWSGTYTDSYDSSDLAYAPSVSTSDSGVSTSQSGMGFAPGLTLFYTVTTGFTVTSPGDFLLLSSGSYSDSASTCTPVNCGNFVSDGRTLDVNFAGGVDIEDSSYNEVLGEFVGGSASVPYTLSCFSPGLCIGNAEASVSDAASGAVYLPLGNYTLALGYTGTNDSLGSNYAGGSIDATIVPTTAQTPEPKELALLIIGMGVMAGLRRRAAIRAGASNRESSSTPNSKS
jgi:hypothetical protein